MKFEDALRFNLPGQCEAAREAESISIKNSVLLRRLNEPAHSGRREIHFAISNITWLSQ